MYPYLLESVLGDWALIPTYGVALALAFTLAYLEALHRTIRFGEDPKHTERLFLIIVLSSLIGARCFHILFEGLTYYRENPKEMLAFWEGGFTFYGGLFVSLGTIYAYCRFYKLSFLHMLDLFTPSAMLGLFWGRLGCFAAGCCWGKPTSLPWGVSYTHPHTLAVLRFTPTHPAQVYEAIACLALYFFLFRRANKKPAAGTVFLYGLIGYSSTRFLVEFTRGDSYRGFVLGGALSVAQFLSALLLFAAVISLRVNKRRQFVKT